MGTDIFHIKNNCLMLNAMVCIAAAVFPGVTWWNILACRKQFAVDFKNGLMTVSGLLIISVTMAANQPYLWGKVLNFGGFVAGG